MCPSVNGNVVLIDIERGLELLRVLEDVLTDKEVGRMFVILCEEVVQNIRRLQDNRRQTMQRKKKKKNQPAADHRQS